MAIWAAARERGIPLVVVGGFAVRAYLSDPDKRTTRDLDLVVSRSTFLEIRALLEERGFRLYDTGSWWRAERGEDERRRVVDIGIDGVVDSASFESYPLAIAETRQVALPGGPVLQVPALEDLLALKLLAHRDKDILDVIALLRDAGDNVDAVRFRQQVERRDLEVPIRRGYLAVVASAESGQLAKLWSDRFGEEFPPLTLADVLRRLHTLFP